MQNLLAAMKSTWGWKLKIIYGLLFKFTFNIFDN